MTDENLKIMRVDLVDESFKTYRDLNGGDPVAYPVLVWLSRHPDNYERIKLAELGILTINNNPMQGLIKDTTLEAVRNRMDVLNSKIAVAARDARGQQEAAAAEDERLRALVDQINEGLTP
jgi:hypothetical protein